MPFSSLFFLFGFLPVFLLCYFLAPNKYRNSVALAGSLFFYAWGAPQFLPVLLLVSWLDYTISWKIYDCQENVRLRKRWITLGILFNLSLLSYFKYANFFVAEVNHLGKFWFGVEGIHWAQVIMPIGISFVVFEEISYLVDVYRGTAKPAQKFSQYALFLFLFPHSIAGPIFRWHDLEAQLRQREHRIDYAFNGAIRFFFGLAKKVLIADQMAKTANLVFGHAPESLNTPFAWLGLVTYTLQIYFDFSGYSDMAIGLGLVLGFKFKENFNAPYIAKNITDFWKRWHISLSTWMRDYLYIPLGGNRKSEGRTYFNLIVVFLVSGFWHGANWTFLCWGIYHGILLIADRLFWETFSAKLPRVVNTVITFFLVMMGWVFFRSESLSYAMAFYVRLFSFSQPIFVDLSRGELLSNRAELFFVLALIICFARMLPRLAEGLDILIGLRRVEVGVIALNLSRSLFVLMLFAFIAMSLVSSKFSPFIYFRF